MKEKYIKPQVDVAKFAATDVVTTSGGGYGGNDSEWELG